MLRTCMPTIWGSSAYLVQGLLFRMSLFRLGQAAASSRLRRSGCAARPYIWRLIVWRQLIWPSTGFVLQGWVIAARTASMSRPMPAACKGGQLTARGIGDPLLEAGIIVAAYHCSKTAGEFARDRKLRRIFMEMVKEPLGLLIERCRVFAREPCTIPARWRREAVDDRSLRAAVRPSKPRCLISVHSCSLLCWPSSESFFEIVSKRTHEDGARGRPPVLGLTARWEPAFDRSDVQANPGLDLSRRGTRLPQLKDFSIELAALVAPRLAQAIKFRGSFYRLFRPGIVVSDLLGCYGFPAALTALRWRPTGLTQRFAQVLEKMPVVGDLRCIGLTPAGALGINAGTIASDDLDARIAFQP